MKYNKKIRVLHVIDHLGLGGAQTIVRDLVEKNEYHYVFALKKTKNHVKFSENSKVFYKDKGKYDLTSVFTLKKIIEKEKIDVLHVHLAKSIFIVYLYMLLFSNTSKIVVNEHGAIFSHKRRFYRFILRRIEKYVSCFIAVSNKTQTFLLEKGKLPPQKVQVIYNFIDFKEITYLTKKQKEKIRHNLKLSVDDFIIGFVGRLSGVKHIETLLDAYPYIGDKNTKILIIGDGELREKLENQAKNYENIIFLGYRSDIRELYQILDIIVLPSQSEASPMAFYESQVYGIPFIGANVYSINEFIQHGYNGLLFEFLNEKDLAEKILTFKSDKVFSKKIKKNALNNLKKFDIKKYNKKLEVIYNE